jgi:hypothetical protein
MFVPPIPSILHHICLNQHHCLADRKNSPIRSLLKILAGRIAPRFPPGLLCIKLSQILHKNGAAENPAVLLPTPADDLS